nr:response regulator transcription factor [Chryseosolibacter histidini]
MTILRSVPANKLNILIVDDEALLREGLRLLLQKEVFTGAVYEADDEETFMHQLGANKIDLVLLDIRLRKISGLELFRKMKHLSSQPYVIAVTGLDGIEVVVELLKSGVNGIVYKLDGYVEISNAIKGVLDSGSYFPKSVLTIIQNNSYHWADIPSVLLSSQEKELLKAIATGVTSKEIASMLKRSPGSTETFRIRLMRKVGVTNTAALLVYAFRNGIL